MEKPKTEFDIQREKILYLISEGYVTKEIADKLKLSFDAVRHHRKVLLIKYKCKTMPQVIKKWMLAEVRSKIMKTGFLILFLIPLFLFSQPDTLCLTGALSGTYTARHEIKVDSVHSYALPVVLQIGSCDTLDDLIPGIGVLGDSCIRDAEWTGETGYSEVLTDSASFFSPKAMKLFKFVGNVAVDDCGIDSFYVKELEIIPPGTGTDRPGNTTKEFRVLFRAVDYVGRFKEALMIWIRDDSGCI